MGKFDYRELKGEDRRQLLNQLAEVVTAFTDKDDTRRFLERLLTPSEIVMLARRWQVAELLVTGRTYEQVRRRLGVGISTIQSVDRWLDSAVVNYQDIRAEQRAREKAELEREKNRKSGKSTVPGTLSHVIEHDSRMILLKLLLGD